MRTLTAALAALLGACHVSSPSGPEPSSVAVHVVNPDAIAPVAPLRLALLFGAGAENARVADVPAEIGAEVQLPLVTPGGPWEAGVAPLELGILPTLETIDIYRPRIVLYEDADGSGDFSPSADVVAAIDTSTAGPGVAAILDLDQALKRMTLEETEAYYEASGGRYTAFIRVKGSRGSLQLASEADAGPLTLRLSDSPIPAEHLTCGRDPVYVYGDALGPAAHVTAHVLDPVTPASFCGPTIPACSAEALDAAAPELGEQDTEGRRRVVQCREGGGFEVLVVHTSVLTCASCLCNHVTSAEVWVVGADGPTPAWWPCGTTVRRCDSTLPIYQIDATCVAAGG